MEQVVLEALDAIRHREWTRLTPMLHPYLHWTDSEGTTRGRRRVLAHLTAHGSTGPPASYELRDGQIYRWTCLPKPG